MKPTPRRNGRHMVTLKSEHRLDSADIASILAKSGDAEWDEDQIVLPALSRTAAVTIIRQAVAAHGNEGWWFWEDGVDDEEVDARAEWAAATVRRLWPELDDGELARFESSHNMAERGVTR